MIAAGTDVNRGEDGDTTALMHAAHAGEIEPRDRPAPRAAGGGKCGGVRGGGSEALSARRPTAPKRISLTCRDGTTSLSLASRGQSGISAPATKPAARLPN